MKLANGVLIPDIGLGVYKMVGGQEMNEAINEAYKELIKMDIDFLTQLKCTKMKKT